MGFIVAPALILFLLCCFGLCALCGRLAAKIAEPILWKRARNGKDDLKDILESVARKTRFCKRIAFLVAFCALFGHDIYTAAQWSHLCNSAGLHVYKKIETDGFLYGHNLKSDKLLENDVRFYLDRGYQYIEAEEFSDDGKTKSLYRYSRDMDGSLKKILISEPQSKYMYERSGPLAISAYIDETKREVKNIETNEIIGMYNWFVLNGGGWLGNFFLDHMIPDRFASSSICQTSDSDVIASSIPPISPSEVRP